MAELHGHIIATSWPSAGSGADAGGHGVPEVVDAPGAHLHHGPARWLDRHRVADAREGRDVGGVDADDPAVERAAGRLRGVHHLAHRDAPARDPVALEAE